MIRSIAIFTDTGRLIVKWSATETTVDYTLLSGLLAAIGTLSSSLGMGKPGIINFENQKVIFVKNSEIPELNFVAEFSSDKDMITCKNLLDFLTQRFIAMYGRLSDDELEGDLRKFRDFPEIIHHFFEAKLDELISKLNLYSRDAYIYFFDSEGNLLFSTPPKSERSLTPTLDLLNSFCNQFGFSDLRSLSGSFSNGMLRLYTFSDPEWEQKFHLLIRISDPRKARIGSKIKKLVKEYQYDIHSFYWQLPMVDRTVRSLVRKAIDKWLESMNVDLRNVRVDWNVLIDPTRHIKADAMVTFQPTASDPSRKVEERVGVVNILNLQIPCTKSEYIFQVKKLESIGNAMKAVPAFVAIYSSSGFSSDALNYHQTRQRINIKNRLMTVYLLSPVKE